MLRPLCQAETVQILHGHTVPFLAPDTLIVKGQFHVLHSILETDQVERLEYEAYHPIAVIRRLGFGQVPYPCACQSVFARVVIVQYAQYIEQCGLARTGLSHYGDELSLPDVQVYALEHMQGLCSEVCLVDVPEVYHPKTVSCL